MAHLDFRQIGAHDYAQLFEHVDRLDLGPEARAQVFRRMVFNVAAANCDDHTKNFSFLLREQGAWELSPAYDVTTAHAPTSRWTRQHLMSVNGRSTGIDLEDVRSVGQRFSVAGGKGIITDVLAAVDRWPVFGKHAEVPASTTTKVKDDLATWSGPLRRPRR